MVEKDNLVQIEHKIEKLERETEVLREDIDEIAKRLMTIEKILSIYYDENRNTYKSRYLDRIYAMLKRLERKIIDSPASPHSTMRR